MKKLLILFAFLACCFSCADIKEDIENLQGRVENLESQLSALKSAYEDGKIIKEVKPYKDEEHTGWTVVFSDNQSINIFDGVDGITPQLAIDAQGYWEVSYDNGATFNQILNGEGAPIISKGKDGVSVRVVVAENGKYAIESYNSDSPETVIETIETPYSSDPASSITSITKDEYNGTISLVMGDGIEYLFNLDVTYPTSVVILAESLVLPKNGTAVFQFRVNPSNAVVDLNLEQDNPMVELDMAIENMTRSYVTVSENYVLEKIESAKDADGNVKEGQYMATITDLGISSEYCEGAAIVINTKDGRGNKIQVSSDIFKIKTPDKPQFITFSINGSYAAVLDKDFITVQLPYGTDVKALKPEFIVSEGVVTANDVEIISGIATDFSSPVKYTITAENGAEASYYVSISYSGIPVVYINTKDAAPVASKDTWLKGTEIYITNAGEHNSLYSESQIKGRGNTTWGYHKKPYAIKLDSKEQVLGMPKHKRWVLLANYLDKTCIRNSIAFEISKRSSGIDWTPRGYHVDVVLNGVFMGNYYLCEQIKADENRVNLPDGGYLLEIDKNYDEVNKFYSPYYERPFMVKEPDEDELTPAAFEYIKNHVTEVEYALKNHSSEEDYLKYIDLDSFIDYWFVYELTATGEPTHPKSVYMWTDAEGKFHAGPVWDFDYFTFHPYYNKRLIFDEWTVWSNPILFDSGTETISGITHYGIPNKVAAIKARWNESREKYRTIIDEIDRQYALVKESAEYNAKMWPIDPVFYVPGRDYDPNREHDLTVDQSVARMKEFYQTHFEFLDNYIKSLNVIYGASGENSIPEIGE